MFYLRKQYVYRNEAGEGDDDGGGGSGNGEGESQTIDEPNKEVEDKARKMGWTPKDEFKGDPTKWREAAEFVERGETMLPIVRKTVEKQEREIAELKRSIKEFAEYHTKTEQRAYERAFKELKAKQVQAVANADAEAFAQVDAEMAELHKEATSRPQPTQQLPAEYVEWASRNRWVDTDATMLAYAESQQDFLLRTKPGLSYSERLEEVSKAVKKEFPEKFSNPRRDAAPSVEGSNVTQKRGGKTYADLPSEAKAACDRAVKHYGIKKEDYLKNYDWEA